MLIVTVTVSTTIGLIIMDYSELGLILGVCGIN